jgi:hypothetical protein
MVATAQDIQAAVKAEREACARVLDEAQKKSNNGLFRSALAIGAALIRERNILDAGRARVMVVDDAQVLLNSAQHHLGGTPQNTSEIQVSLAQGSAGSDAGDTGVIELDVKAHFPVTDTATPQAPDGETQPAVHAVEGHSFSKGDMEAMLPAVISDLKHASEPQGRVRNNANIRRGLYKNVILAMNDRDKFGAIDPLGDGSTRVGLFIKGYVRDVWAYLENAYDLIHDTDFEIEHARLIQETT